MPIKTLREKVNGHFVTLMIVTAVMGVAGFIGKTWANEKLAEISADTVKVTAVEHRLELHEQWDSAVTAMIVQKIATDSIRSTRIFEEIRKLHDDLRK